MAGGKSGNIYVVNSADMGEYSTTADNIVQQWQGGFLLGAGHVFFNSTLYVWTAGNTLQAYSFNGANAVPPYTDPPFNLPPVQGSMPIVFGTKNLPAMSVSANGTAAGSGILWATYSLSGEANGNPYPAVFQAFDASTLSLIYDASVNPNDNPGDWSKWCPPTVANGKVYLATFDGVVNVYGLLQ